MRKVEIITVCSAVVIAVSSVVSGMVWVDTRIDTHSAQPHVGAVADHEFERFVEIQSAYNQQILDRLQSIEEAIRTK